MPNIKSAKKRVLIAKVNSERNKADKSALKTTLKKFEAAVAEGTRNAGRDRGCGQSESKSCIHANSPLRCFHNSLF